MSVPARTGISATCVGDTVCAQSLTPSHYVIGKEVKSLRAPDPSPQCVQEAQLATDSPKWRRMVSALFQWTSQNTATIFKGEDDSATFQS